MTAFLRKYGFFVISICFAGFLLLYYQSVSNTDYTADIQEFQKEFIKTDKELDAFLSKKKNILEKDGLGTLLHKNESEDFFFHVYRNDSLIFWNTNQLPILRFADLHYPANGVVHLQNGWYYAKTITVGNTQLVASFLIKKQYFYENKNLKNDFNPRFSIPFKGNIILEKENAYPIYKDKQFIFALYPYENQPIPSSKSDTLLILLLGTTGFFLFALYKASSRWKNITFWAVPISVILLRILSLKGNWLYFLQETTAFQPTLYANSEWFPNFGEYLINCLIIFYLSAVVNKKILLFLRTKNPSTQKSHYILLFSFYILNLFFCGSIWDLYRGLVENSSIPLEVNKLFSLNFYSFLATISMGVLFYSYFQLMQSIIKGLRKNELSLLWMFLFWLLTSILYLFFEIQYRDSMLVLAFWPMLINLLLIYSAYKFSGKQPFAYGVLMLFLFAVYISMNLQEFYNKKERQERELFANQLASDQDITTEVEYTNLAPYIETDEYLKRVIAEGKLIGVSEFKDAMEKKFFNGFWERYDAEFFLFNSKKEPLINYKNVPGSRLSKLESIITRHSVKSEIDSNIFFIKDFTSQYCYIIRQPIFSVDSSKALLYCALKSKKIPEKIGFPRLLISSNAKVFESLENYSIAKYYNGKLVSRNGKFSYPSEDQGLSQNMPDISGFFDSDGYNHYLLRRTQRDTIILSRQNHSTIQFFTSFSYLFSFYGLFLLIPIYMNSRSTSIAKRTLNLAFRIQVVLIGLVLVALVAFGWGSGLFVKNQYQEYTNDLIREKIRSVEAEIKEKLGEEEELSIVNQGNFIEYLLQNLSSVFVTDINLYDKNGNLLASSRPKVYNIGLVSEQMNPAALFQLRKNSKSEYFHQEKIGNLDYLSGYVPFYSNEGNLLAYLNLQHFGQQKEFEDQIQQFLVAIMNVFILLLALSITAAIFISTWVTLPLRILQQNFAKVQLGKYNQPISYSGNDEIGILVKDYNEKLQELAYATQQLAQSERESAWREMAKQVAHEIKNPLTPMKLSLQHLQRIFDPNDPDSKKKLDKVAASIIEQIDALANIANEFSNFAKMPKADESRIDLVPLIDNVILFFQEESETEIEFFHATRECWVFADRELMLRVFNNLIKNAIQAIPDERIGTIAIYIHKKENYWKIEIKDNGSGITEEQQDKLFVPYFTTKSNGTGLGLAMVKQIIEMHHGKINYETSPQGTTFIIDIPISVEK